MEARGLDPSLFVRQHARKHPARIQAARSRRVGTPIAVAAIVAAGLLAYANSFAGVFVFDDEPAIVENPNIKTLWPLSAAISAPPGTTLSGRPVVSLSLALNYALAPPASRDVLSATAQSPPGTRARLLDNLWGYHAFNLLVHLATALTLFGI